MRRYALIAFLVLLTGCLYASRAEAVGQVNVDIFSGFNPVGGGVPYSGPVGSFTSPDVQFASTTGFSWHPFSQTNFGADIHGPLNVPTTGVYSFTLNSDDGSLLFIDGVQRINDGGPHGPAAATNPAVPLTAGLHNFEVQFFEDFGDPSGVDLTIPEGITFTPEPSTLLLMAPGMVGMAWYWRRRKIA